MRLLVENLICNNLVMAGESVKTFWTPVKIIFSTIFACALVAAVAVIIVVAVRTGESEFRVDYIRPKWGYRCEDQRCVRQELSSDDTTLLSLGVCQLTCAGDFPNTVWPLPSQSTKLSNQIVTIDVDRINIDFEKNQVVDSYYSNEVEQRFLQQIRRRSPKGMTARDGGVKMTVEVDIADGSMARGVTFSENYHLMVGVDVDGNVGAQVHAPNFYGARHAIETLAQLIVYDEIRNEIVVLAAMNITDAPVFRHRGLSLDTSRNYYPVAAIKRTIDGMAMTKANVLHWHLTDTNSFPIEIKSHPEFMELGAYSPHKIYTVEDVTDLVKYARARGVLIMPEFDQPAHVGEGWQRTPHLLTCFNERNWQDHCVQPPCGQLNPVIPEVYDILEDIYRDLYEMFDSPPIFHLGGDEIFFGCWNRSETVVEFMTLQGWVNRDEVDFMKLWNYFQANVLERFDRVTGNTRTPIILWSSHLTQLPYLTDYLDPSRYIIQFWDEKDRSELQDLINLGYNLIMSNVDAMYLDCGFSGWVTAGHNWCSPYKDWHAIYENRPSEIAGDRVGQFIGGEAALWSEQSDENTLDTRIWPRLSAFAERLWSDPIPTWHYAETRLIIHRYRLVENGIAADHLVPEWCMFNDNECPLDRL